MSRNKRLESSRVIGLHSVLFLFSLFGGLVGPAAAGAQESAPKAATEDVQTVTLRVHHSTVLRPPWPVKRVAVADPNIADVKGLATNTVMLVARAVGETDVMMWNEKEEMWYVYVSVVMDTEAIKKELARLFPNSDLDVSASDGTLVVTGSLGRAEYVEQLHRLLDSKKIKYVDATSLAGVQQVKIDVRVAEVSRVAIRALGLNGVFTGREMVLGNVIGSDGGGPIQPISIGSASGALATAQPTPLFNSAVQVSPAVSFFAAIPQARLQLFFQALAENQYMRILAEPTLVALSGQEASFLAGGQIPIPVVQGGGVGGASATVTIEWKDFGVRLKFRPVVQGDNSIRLMVAPEVSELSTVGALVVSGFSIPALTVRKAETTLELHSGETFAMAGLISQIGNSRNSRIPGAGDIPVLGALFRSVRYENDETEMVVLVTSSLVEPQSLAHAPPLPGEMDTVPDDWELYGLGRLEGLGPPKLSQAQAAWVKEHGLDHLRGPGAWKSCDEKPHHAKSTPATMPASWSSRPPKPCPS